MQDTSLEIWATKYALKGKDGVLLETSFDDTYKRVAKALARNELDPEKCEEEFLWALRNGAVPAGRIMSNAGAEDSKPNTSTINCTVSNTIVDSMRGIMDTVHDAGLTLAAGCGIGYDFSTLRPKGAFVAGVGAYTSGVLSFMNIYDSMCFTVASAGGRRGAQMATLDISHPDVEEFIKAKRENGRLRQFNLSLLITDEFMEAVKYDREWLLTFPKNVKETAEETVWKKWPYVGANMEAKEGLVLHKVYKRVKARELWELIMQSTYNFAEPGFILIDKVNRENNLYFCEEIRATNPCVPGNTLILTKEGYVEIASCVGEQVEVWNGEEWSTVTPRVTGYDQKMVKVSLSDGSSLVCTEAHKWVIQGEGKVEASNLRLGDKLGRFSLPLVSYGVAVDLKAAYTQGFFSGDGCVNTGKCDRKEIWLYGEKKELAQHLNHSNAWEDVEKGRVCLTVYRDQLADKTFVPMNWDSQGRLSWLAGLLDSDGTVNDKGGSVSVSSIDRNFLASTKLLLTTLGIKSTLAVMKVAARKNMPDGKGGQKEYNCAEAYRLLISAYYVGKLLELEIPLRRLNPQPSVDRCASRFIRVTEIEKVESCKTVYCFTEEKRGQGIFNGIMTGQCGEQPLPPYGACLLGSINLTKFVSNPFTEFAKFDYDGFGKVVRVFTRMLDNVVEMNGLPLEEQVSEITRKRRHGMGFFGLGSTLALMGIKYGSDESLKVASAISKTLCIQGWEEGVSLAIKKGPAPIMEELFDGVQGKELFGSSVYLKRCLPVGLRSDIKRYGSRFTHHTSIAPTGTISLSFGNNASNGIEPSFSHEYNRNVIVEGEKTKRQVKVYSYEAWLWNQINPGQPYPEYFSTSDSISPEDHIRVQAAVQPWIDSAISKTVNVPTDCNYEEFKSLYMTAYSSGLKGCTTFRFNPEAFSGVLVTDKDLSDTKYRFTLESGEVVELRGDEEVEYDGAIHKAANLFDALKEGYYGKF